LTLLLFCGTAEAFSEGFHEVCGGPALRLFRHEELELLVCGLPHLDFSALESVTRYDGGYTKKSPAILMFWKVRMHFNLVFLAAFVTQRVYDGDKDV
jgi:hypothetical protein